MVFLNHCRLCSSPHQRHLWGGREGALAAPWENTRKSCVSSTGELQVGTGCLPRRQKPYTILDHMIFCISEQETAAKSQHTMLGNLRRPFGSRDLYVCFRDFVEAPNEAWKVELAGRNWNSLGLGHGSGTVDSWWRKVVASTVSSSSSIGPIYADLIRSTYNSTYY